MMATALATYVGYAVTPTKIDCRRLNLLVLKTNVGFRKKKEMELKILFSRKMGFAFAQTQSMLIASENGRLWKKISVIPKQVKENFC